MRFPQLSQKFGALAHERILDLRSAALLVKSVRQDFA